MTREEKIEAIYKEMANKELTLGCKLTVVESFGPCDGVVFYSDSLGSKVLRDDGRRTTETKNSDFFIIGHPVMIGDVISYLRKPFNEFIESKPVGENWLVDRYFNDMNNLLVKWFDTSLPIDEQDDECVNFVSYFNSLEIDGIRNQTFISFLTIRWR